MNTPIYNQVMLGYGIVPDPESLDPEELKAAHYRGLRGVVIGAARAFMTPSLPRQLENVRIIDARDDDLPVVTTARPRKSRKRGRR